MRSGHHIISVSLGGAGSPTGLAVIEPRSAYWHPKGNESEIDYKNYFDVLWLERLDAGRPFPAIVARVRKIASERQLARGYDILVDITRTGSAPLRLFEDLGLHYVQPVEITNTAEATYQNGIQYLPRRDMIGTAQVALQDDKLKVSDGLDLAATLLTDLQAFDPTMTGRAAETGRNDDLVTAVAIAVWWADRLHWNEEVADRMLPDDDDYVDETGRSFMTGY